jgi:hypothetical protein
MERKLRKQAKRQAARRAMLDGIPANRQDPRRRPTQQGPTTEPKIERRLPRAPGGTVACGWCGATVTVPNRGRIPKWCSATCRHRAWEQRRAAASGRAAIEVVDRPVEVVRTITKVQRVIVEAPIAVAPQTVDEWAGILAELTDRLDRGRIYDRDVPALRPAVAALVDAFNRRWT